MDLIVIDHNLRSAHNVGSLLRTAEGLGVGKIYLTGYSPYPQRETLRETDERLPHLAARMHQQISKTSLNAEKFIDWQHVSDILGLLTELRSQGYTIAALEQAPHSTSLPSFKPPKKLVIIIGREVEGIETDILEKVDQILEIPMSGQKESFNVVQAAAIALYHCKYLAGL